MSLAPLRRYHQEWWRAKHDPNHKGLRANELARAYRRAAEAYRGEDSYAKANKDPMPAAIRAAAKVGWAFVNANTLTNAKGQ